MRILLAIPPMMLLLACGGQRSNEESLRDAANQSTPEAAQVLNGAAENGMDTQQALNEAAEAQASNASTNAPTANQP